MAWPSYYVTFISAFSVFNFDFVPWQALSCAVTMNFYDKVTGFDFILLFSVFRFLFWSLAQFHGPRFFVAVLSLLNSTLHVTIIRNNNSHVP